MESKSSDELRQAYMDAMGIELGLRFHELERSFVHLQVLWLQYRALYAEEDNVALLNRTAGLAFMLIQDEVWDGVMLRIARLTDPVQQRGNDNLTLFSMPPLIPDADLKTEVMAACKDAKTKADSIRVHRNKRLAHLDLRYALDQSEPLSGVSRADIELVLTSMREVFNLVHGHYRQSETHYEGFVDHSGARVLVETLRERERLVERYGRLPPFP